MRVCCWCGCHAYVWEHESSLLVRALGLSSWSENSTTCQTTSVPAPPFDYFLYVIVPLVALLGCVIVGFVVHVFTNLSKVIAPKLRRRDDKPIISEFVSSDMTPMEEHDPPAVVCCTTRQVARLLCQTSRVRVNVSLSSTTASKSG